VTEAGLASCNKRRLATRRYIAHFQQLLSPEEVGFQRIFIVSLSAMQSSVPAFSTQVLFVG
jgi:hypothetical protein